MRAIPGGVPAAAGEAERRRGDAALHGGPGALRTGRRIRIGQLLQALEAVAAFAAFEVVDGHGGQVR